MSKKKLDILPIDGLFTSTGLKIDGQIYLISSEELIKIVKTRYETRENRNFFPQLVEDYLSGEISSLDGFSVLDRSNAEKDLGILGKIIRHRKGIIALREINPLVPVTEYKIEETIFNGTSLKELNLPLGINGKFNQNEVAFDALILKTETNIITSSRGKNYSKYADLLAVVAVFLMALGAGFMASRGKLIELGLPMLVIGVFICYLLFISDWGKVKFSLPALEIEGASLMVVEFPETNE